MDRQGLVSAAQPLLQHPQVLDLEQVLHQPLRRLLSVMIHYLAVSFWMRSNLHLLLLLGTTSSTCFGSGFGSGFGTTSSATPTFSFNTPATTSQSLFSGFGQNQATTSGGKSVTG